MTRIADPTLPYGGTWTFEVIQDGRSSVVRITENGEVRNPIFRFLSRFAFSKTASIEAYLRALGSRMGRAW